MTEWVARARPEAALAEAVESRRVVVVSATAGAGKTTLVAAVTQQLDRPVAWLRLDWTDNAPERLVMYLEAALAAVVPRVRGLVGDALATGIPYPEAAGLLLEAVTGERVVLVVDELERLGEGSDAWRVIEALSRNTPPDLRLVLCSRRALPASVLPGGPSEVVRLGDEVLALTVEEAACVLQLLGRRAVDPAAAVHASGGWMTGVLFEAARASGQDLDGGPDDPLHDYFSAHVLAALCPEDREFLIVTSLLTEITAARATALGAPDAGARLASLRAGRASLIPAVWTDAGHTLCCHPHFHEYLQDLLESWEAERLRALRVAHGRLLAAEGRDEVATEVLLRAGAGAEAREPAARAILEVINRLDFATALRWLDALADVEPDGMLPLVTARLTLAVASENHRLGVELADRLAARDKLAEVASSSSATALMLAHCHVMCGRYDDMLQIASRAPHDAGHEALRAYIDVHAAQPPARLPELTGTSLDGVLLPIVYRYGRLAGLLESTGPVSRMPACSQPWAIAALADSGRLATAVDLLEDARAGGRPNAALEAVVAPHVLTDAGRRNEALQAIARGRELAGTGPSVIYELLAGIEEARLRLRIDRDPEAALAALDPVDRHPMTHRVGLLGPQVDTWYGCALLLAERDAEALERLRSSRAIEERTGRMLDMPATAVYLAEAEWRMGNEDAADAAADIALEAARVQGFNHLLLLALRDFPAVLARRLDAEPAADSPWHEIARALHAQRLAVAAPVRASVRLVEFGRSAILVDGQEVRPRIAKTYELLAYLLTQPQHRAERRELLEALFGGRTDRSARAYLRQAVRWLRTVLPPDGLVTEGATVMLGHELAVVSDSLALERELAQAASLRGTDRLHAILSALEIYDRGSYLAGLSSHWVEERGHELRELATDARYEAAELAFAAGRLEEAERLAEDVLGGEPYHEPAWRLAMRLASARGDDQAVLRSYQRCDQVLAAVGAAPSATTRELVNQLRR